MRSRATAGALVEASQNGMEVAAKRLLDSSVTTDDRKDLKDAFAKEMERCQDVVADEREAQRRKAQERLEARKKKREAAKKEEQAGAKKTPAHKGWLKARNVMGGVKEITKVHNRVLTKKFKEHADIERRVRDECATEMQQFEARLRRQSEEEIAKLKAMYAGMAQTANATAVTDKDIAQTREAGVAKADEARDLVETERQKQAAKIEKRLADRKKRLQKKEAVTRHGHAQEEVRLELQYEKDKLDAKPLERKKAKQLVKELNKVKNLIGKLQDPDGTILGSASPCATQESTAAAIGRVRSLKSQTPKSANAGSANTVFRQPPEPPEETRPGYVRELEEEEV